MYFDYSEVRTISIISTCDVKHKSSEIATASALLSERALKSKADFVMNILDVNLEINFHIQIRSFQLS